MLAEDIAALLREKHGEHCVIETDTHSTPHTLLVPMANLEAMIDELYRNEKLYFDFLSCLTGLDNGPAAGTMEVLYHLYSIPHNHTIALKVILKRPELPSLPEIPTVTHIWKSALWHEREAYDLLGIHFTGHPDLRRILLPADWKGFPLRKDYEEQDYYHGIKVAY